MHNLHRPLLLILFISIISSHLQAQVVGLEIVEVSSTGTHFLVTGPDGREVAVDISTDMINWAEWERLTLADGAADLQDPEPGTTNPVARFYQARLIALTGGPGSLIAARSPILGGDRIAVLLTGSCDGLTSWEWRVNGIAGGDASTGTFIQSPVDPCKAYYTAPVSGGDFELQAVDPADETRKAVVNITVYPLTGELVIVPSSPNIGVGGKQAFFAGVDVPGFGFLPLTSVIWQLNNMIGGDPSLGSVSLDGIYTAPDRLPPNDQLPATIEVGFSFGIEQDVAVSTNVTLVDLEVSPNPVVRYLETANDPDPPAKLTIQRRYSNKTTQGLIPGSSFLVWSSTDPEVADINSTTGEITINSQPGETGVEAVDQEFQIKAVVTVEGREPGRIWNVEAISSDAVTVEKIGDLFEVTQSNVSFGFDPQVTISREPVPVGANPGRAYVNQMVTLVKATGGNNNYAIYDASQPGVPALTGLSARMDDRNFRVDVGETPGSGPISFTYEHDTWSDWYDITFRFTRLNMAVSALANRSYSTEASFITEWIDFEVTLENPYKNGGPNGEPASKFMAKTPVKVEVVGGAPFWIRADEYARTGTLPPSSLINNLQKVARVESFTGYVAPVHNPPSGEYSYPHPDEGKVRFSISPTTVGNVTFRISVPNDPGIPPQDITFNVKRPRLQTVNQIGSTLPDNQVVIGSWVGLEIAPEDPNIQDFEIVEDTQWREAGPIEWIVTKPDGQIERIPATLDYGFYLPFWGFYDQKGEMRVAVGLRDRPEVRTEDAVISIVSPMEVIPFLDLGDNPWIGTDEQIPPTMKIGGFEVIRPVRGVWKPGVPLEVEIQCYDATGNPAPVGYTVELRQPFYNFFSKTTTVSYPNPSISGANAEIIWPTYIDPVYGEMPMYVDSNGVSRFTIIPTEEQYYHQADLMIGLDVWNATSNNLYFDAEPQLFLTEYDETNQKIKEPTRPPPSLDGVNYADPDYAALYRQVVRISGHGMILNPNLVPIPTQRVRDAIAAGMLPPGSDHIRLIAEGTEGFDEAVASGVSAVDPGQGFTVISTSPVEDGLEIVLAADYQYWDAVEPYWFTFEPLQEVVVTFADKTVWPGSIQMFLANIEPSNPNGEVDLALNGRYEMDSEPGTVSLDLEVIGIKPVIDMELLSSIDACWDENGNGISDTIEDMDDNNIFDEADAYENAPEIRGGLPVNPIIGFSRYPDPESGELNVRGYKRTVRPGFINTVTIYGSLADRRTLDSSGILSPAGEPDGLPDFVSPDADSESILVRSGGNLADIVFFTAYNFMAEPLAPSGDPGITWDSTMENDLTVAYERYSDFNRPTIYNDLAATYNDPERSFASVWIDHEAQDKILHFRQSDDSDYKRYLKGQLRTQFYAGILDQFFQAENIQSTLQPLGRDGRVKPYDYFGSGSGGTGLTRYTFGLALDGVLYDAFYGALPRPRASDTFFNTVLNVFNPAAVYGLRASAANRFDLNPNSPELLQIPVVNDLIATTGALTTNNLLPHIGGSSGGFVDIVSGQSPRLLAESKLPGAELPGLHAGYLLKDKPVDQRDPVTELVEDDIEQVSLNRFGDLGGAAGAPLIEENVFLGTTQKRNVHVFGGKLDKKLPISTSITVASEFAIITDPINVAPKNLDSWKIKAGLLVRELPGEEDFEVDLLATTQSEGDEEAIKMLADFAVDTAVDLVSKVILNAITVGNGLGDCGGVGGAELTDVGTAALNLWLGPVEDEFYSIRPFGSPERTTVFAMSGLLNGFDTPIEGYETPKLTEILPFEKVIDKKTGKEFIKLNPVVSAENAKIIEHCKILELPVNRLKEEIKNTYSARTFGGQGSAEAAGTKVLAVAIPPEAQLGTQGVYSAFTSVTRKAFIKTNEPFVKPLSELPWQTIWGEYYPYPDEVSDDQLFRDLLIAREDPDKADHATAILRAAGSSSLMREMDRETIEGPMTIGPGYYAQEQKESLYQSYKLRHWEMIDIGLYVGPGHSLDEGNNQAFGDYAFTPNKTIIPVSYGSAVSTGRSNENGNARAKVRFNGVEIKLVNTVILEPDS